MGVGKGPLRKAFDIRRLHDVVAVASGDSLAVLIGHDEQDVGSLI